MGLYFNQASRAKALVAAAVIESRSGAALAAICTKRLRPPAADRISSSFRRTQEQAPHFWDATLDERTRFPRPAYRGDHRPLPSSMLFAGSSPRRFSYLGRLRPVTCGG